jgi:hypothetical protein
MKRYFLLITMLLASAPILFSQESKPRYDAFSFSQQLTLPGTPVAVFDKITGDIRPWWDHSFSEKPYKLYIEPKPGGGFYEIFDEAGNGVKHATVIYADRGKMLRFEGPLGLSGMAVTMVCTYKFEAAGSDSTKLTLDVHGAGEVPEGIPAIVEQVWHHFLFERFKPYMEGKLE